MLISSTGIARYYEINNWKNDSVPTGWCVREIFSAETGETVSLNYGCFIADNTFISIPIHFSLKDKLIPINGYNTTTERYYAIPKDFQVGVSSFVKKKTNRVVPLLVPPSEKFPAKFVASIAVDYDSTILNAAINGFNENIKVVKKFIDKQRFTFCCIAFNDDSNVINPSVVYNISTGNVGRPGKIKVTSYVIDPDATNVNYQTVDSAEPIVTSFINLPSFTEEIEAKLAKKAAAKATDDNSEKSDKPVHKKEGFKKPYNKKPYNKNKNYHKTENVKQTTEAPAEKKIVTAADFGIDLTVDDKQAARDNYNRRKNGRKHK